MIEIQNISKSFKTIGSFDAQHYFFKSLWQHLRGKDSRKEILKDISLTIEQGERVAFVGPNKTGKTTLAHIIAGIINPDSGSVLVEGKIVSVFGLGVGYSSLLTGRENLILNATALGASFAWLRDNLGEIFNFAEIEEIDMPIKFYSNGMRARLALAAALFIPCDILILDEVFSGLDEQFREKCFQFLNKRMQNNNTTLIMIDHDPQIRNLFCNRVVIFS